MRIEPIEIYSDATNAAVMRHPGRKFPGVLVQGDTLNSLWRRLEKLHPTLSQHLSEDDLGEFDYVRERMGDLVQHYANVLAEHGLDLPFSVNAPRP